MARSFGPIPQPPHLAGRIYVSIRETLESVEERRSRGDMSPRIIKSAYTDVILGEARRTHQVRIRNELLDVLMPDEGDAYGLERSFPGEEREEIAARFRTNIGPSL